tara:strand:+ start:2841 stop:6308 length:3468 start_codon:yes stop_codon:yes gene_type:complete
MLLRTILPPCALLLPVLTSGSLAAAQDLRPGIGLTATRVSAASHSQLSLAVGPTGRVYVGTESPGLVEAIDADGDGFYEHFEPLDTGGLHRIQGILAEADALFVVAIGQTNGERVIGLWKTDVDGRDPQLVLGFDGDDEHSPHAVVRGPDGALYLTHGDMSRPRGHPSRPVPAQPPTLLRPLPDPAGFGQRGRWPFGGIVRVEPTTGAWRWRGYGLRNPYDLVFDDEGECFTVDADMEWDLGWGGYRPTRAALVVEGGDHGWRPGSDPLQGWSPDAVPPIAELERGSPTGVLLTDTLAFPEDYDNVLLYCDWIAAELVGVRLSPQRSGFTGTKETVLSCAGPMPLTDMAALPDGSLLLTSGGRGQTGSLIRLAPEEPRTTERAPRENATARVARRELEDPDGAPIATNVLLSPTDDPWILQARRRHFPAALRSGPPRVAGIMGKNYWWPELHMAEPRFKDKQDAHDLVNFLWINVTPELRIKQLRAGALVLANGGKIDSLFAANFENRLKQLLDDPEPAIWRQAAEMLSSRTTKFAAETLLVRLAAETDRVQATYLARCVANMATTLSSEHRVRALAFLEEASGWGGNVSYAGWIQTMFDVHLRAAGKGELLELAQAGELGPRTLATALARAQPADVPALVPALRTAFDAIGIDTEPAIAAARRRSTLSALGSDVDPVLGPWLRELVDADETASWVALMRLASLQDPVDAQACFEGLMAHRHEVRGACGQYWSSGIRFDPDADQSRRLIDTARKAGPRRGGELLGHLASMTGASPNTGSWDAKLLRWQRWFQETHPDATVPEASPVDGPRWSSASILEILNASPAHAGSSARGALVLERVGCNACHGFGANFAVTSGYGPDLTGLTKRFDLAGILDAIRDPSRDVPEHWRAFEIVAHTDSGIEILEGRVLREDEREVAILLPSGREKVFARRDVESLKELRSSPMPEGLIDDLTIEEVRDLIAHLRADGVVDPDEAAQADWTDMLSEGQLKHWRGSMKGWDLERGVLWGTAEDLAQNEYMIYGRDLADFEVEFDVLLEGGNSGLQYRSRVEDGTVDPIGYQADIGQRFWGSIYGTDGRAKLAGPELLLMESAVRRDGWNHYHLRVDGARHVLEVNGVVLSELEDDAHRSGVLALQLHQKLKMKVWFANLRVRPLR